MSSGPARNDAAWAPRLLADAERTANSIVDDSSKVEALSGIARIIATTSS